MPCGDLQRFPLTAGQQQGLSAAPLGQAAPACILAVAHSLFQQQFQPLPRNEQPLSLLFGLPVHLQFAQYLPLPAACCARSGSRLTSPLSLRLIFSALEYLTSCIVPFQAERNLGQGAEPVERLASSKSNSSRHPTDFLLDIAARSVLRGS